MPNNPLWQERKIWLAPDLFTPNIIEGVEPIRVSQNQIIQELEALDVAI
jgi:hypothetical protein